jgi:alginate O-acetyltransferase complex protein AlgJ
MRMDKNKGFFNGRGWRSWLPAKESGCLPLLFLLFISLPLMDQVFKFLRPFELVEKRKLAEKPAFALRQPFRFMQRYENYYNDYFPFRTRLVYLNNLLTYKIFRTSATAKVIIGRQGWLFLGNINPFFDEIDYYRNLKPFTIRELRYWQILLEERRDWLKRRGIDYIFTIAPNKSTIYPEFMPAAIKKIHAQSRLDQLIAHLEKYSRLRILDLRPALREAKKIRPTYYRTDTHWNDWGGYVAYGEIINNVRSRFNFISPRPLPDYRLEPSDFRSGDLALMLSLPDIFWETEWRIRAKDPLHARVVPAGDLEPKNNLAAITVHACAAGTLPAALMVHDSFAHPLKQFLSEDFSKTVYIMNWALNFWDKVIEREKVKIVIDEMVEYSLLNRFPVNPAALRR